MERERKDERVEVYSHRVLLFEKYLFTCSVIFFARFRIDRDAKHERIDRGALSRKRRACCGNKDLITRERVRRYKKKQRRR